MLRDSEIRGVRAARVTTIKLLRLQIHGVSFKEQQNDVNSKRHHRVAFTVQQPPGWKEAPPENTIYMFVLLRHTQAVWARRKTACYRVTPCRAQVM